MRIGIDTVKTHLFVQLIAIDIGQDVLRYYLRPDTIVNAEVLAGAMIEPLAVLFGEQ